MFWDEADKGELILFDLATDKKYKDRNATYFDNDRTLFTKEHPDAYDLEKIEKLVKITEEVLKRLNCKL